MGTRWLAWLALPLIACGGEAAAPPPDPPPEEPPPPPPQGCAAGSVELGDGSCRPAGIDVAACAEGFVAAGDVCEPVLPTTACPPGQLAIPGDVSCHEIAACGSAPWGDIPIDGATVFVDDDYTALDADGSAQKPWPSLQQAVDAAADGSLVAIAAGNYAGNTTISGKSLTLWGRCPELVSLVGSVDPMGAALVVGPDATGTTVRSVALTGATRGLLVVDSIDVALQRAWVHDAALHGLVAERVAADTGVVVEDSLFELNRSGISAAGADLTLTRSAIRSHRYDVVEQTGGFGVGVYYWIGRRGSGSITRTLIDDNQLAGIFVGGSDVTIEGVFVTSTSAVPDTGYFGRGLFVVDDADALELGDALVRSSVIDESHDGGVYISGGRATLEETLVRNTQPAEYNQAFGRGIGVQHHPSLPLGASLTMSWSIVENHREMGLFIAGADAAVEGSIIRDIQPQDVDGLFGRCISMREYPGFDDVSTLTFHGSVVQRCHEGNIIVVDSQASITATLVEGARADPQGRRGDGVTLASELENASLELLGVTIRDSARAGFAAFGGTASLENTTIECNAIDINAENAPGAPEPDPIIADVGGNVCACGDVEVPCRIISTGLQPPQPAQL